MPYIIVKCGVDDLATGTSYFGDERTDKEIVNYVKILSGSDIDDTMCTTTGFYAVEQPACWLLNSLENVGYKASAPSVVGSTFYWILHKGSNK